MNEVNLKQELLAACQDKVGEMIKRIEKELDNYRLASSEETKSSAGDKYETGREMLQQEMTKIALQLDNAFKLRKTLVLIDPKKPNQKIQLGSLVKTVQSNFFISISLGKLELRGQIYYAVSAASPIAQAMLGRKEKESFEFNSQKFQIQLVN